MVASLVESMADILDIATIGKVERKQCFDHKLDGSHPMEPSKAEYDPQRQPHYEWWEQSGFVCDSDAD